MKTSAKIILGLLGLGAVGGMVAAVVSSSGGSSNPNNGSQDAPIERPGYKILPNCGGFEVTDIAAATAYARNLVKEVPAAGWDVAVLNELYGPACSALTQDDYIALVKVSAPFFYKMLRAIFQGAIDVGIYTEAQANELLAKSRNNWKAYVSEQLLTPTKVFD